MGCFSRNAELIGRRKMLLAARCVWLLSNIIILFCGCKRRGQSSEPELAQVITNRMQDAAYVQALQENSTRQMANAHAREKLVLRQKACAERIMASLPADADDEALKAALQKDAEWVELEAEAKEVARAAQQAQEDAKLLIRGRLEAEAQAIKDVQSGKARAAEPGQAK